VARFFLAKKNIHGESATIAGAAIIFSLRIFQDCATATAAVARTLKTLGFGETR